MKDRSHLTPTTLSIAAVERDTGLSKDTLRVWERRYGFPLPGRDAAGERQYTGAQMDKLRTIKRLLDAGHRPGRIVPLTLEQLQAQASQTRDGPGSGVPPARVGDDLRQRIDLIRSHDTTALRSELARLVSHLGVARFATEVVADLNAAVGEAWLRGQLEVFEEHLYTETVQTVLRTAIAGVPEPAADDSPRALLATFPGEPHGLGLLMAQAVLADAGCRCVSLGVQTPLWDIVRAAAALRSDIVALSFSGCMGPNPVASGLAELRAKLPAAVAVWAGGSAPVLHRRPLAGVRPMATLAEVPAALQEWLDARSRAPAA